MRKILFFTFLFLISTSSFSQQNSHQDYLQKSKNQKKAGVILLSGGASLMIISFIIPRGELTYDGTCVGGLCDEKYKNDGIRSAFFIVGAVTALSSIPLFIIAGKNRRKATAVGLKIESTTQPYNQSFVYTSFPVIRVKLSF